MVFFIFDATILIVICILLVICGIGALGKILEFIVKLRFVALALIFILGVFIAREAKFIFYKVIIVLQTILACCIVNNMCVNFLTSIQTSPTALTGILCIIPLCVPISLYFETTFLLCECEKIGVLRVIKTIINTVMLSFAAILSFVEFSMVTFIAYIFWLPIYVFIVVVTGLED